MSTRSKLDMSGTNCEISLLLLRQFEIAWQLTQYHLQGLTTEECLWRPAAKGLHVQQGEDGVWRADWPEQEGYDLGPSSIAWTTWHICFWWSMTLHHLNLGQSQEESGLSREQVNWPGSAEAVISEIERLKDVWCARLAELSDEQMRSTQFSRWPMPDRPFAEVAGWLNLELMKNAAEIGYARFLHAASGDRLTA